MREIFIALIMLISFPIFANVALGEQSLFVDHHYSQPAYIGKVINININTLNPYNVTGENTQQMTYDRLGVINTNDKHNTYLSYEVGWRGS